MSESVIPDRADDDSDVGWGELPPDRGEDERLLGDRPPHHESRES